MNSKDIISKIQNKIGKIESDLEFITDIATNGSSKFDKNKKLVNFLKTEFKTLYKYQYELTQYSMLLERFESYEQDGQPENVLYTQIIGEIDCYVSSLKNELLTQEPMPCTTILTYNLCSLWEVDVKQKLIKELSIFLK